MSSPRKVWDAGVPRAGGARGLARSALMSPGWGRVLRRRERAAPGRLVGRPARILKRRYPCRRPERQRRGLEVRGGIILPTATEAGSEGPPAGRSGRGSGCGGPKGGVWNPPCWLPAGPCARAQATARCSRSPASLALRRRSALLTRDSRRSVRRRPSGHGALSGLACIGPFAARALFGAWGVGSLDVGAEGPTRRGDRSLGHPPRGRRCPPGPGGRAVGGTRAALGPRCSPRPVTGCGVWRPAVVDRGTVQHTLGAPILRARGSGTTWRARPGAARSEHRRRPGKPVSSMLMD